MKVKFLHPRTSVAFDADVDPETTGQTCLDNLIKEGFIEAASEAQSYAIVLTRTKSEVPPAMSMQEAQVQPNDSLLIVQPEHGADTGTGIHPPDHEIENEADTDGRDGS